MIRTVPEKTSPKVKPKKLAAGGVAAGVEVLKSIQEIADRSVRTSGPKMARAVAAANALPMTSVKFLMKIDEGMSVRLEKERRDRGLRSRVETIRALLEEGLGR